MAMVDKYVSFDDSQAPPETHQEIQIEIESAAEQGISVRTEPVKDISVDDLQSEETLLNQVSQ